jgi:hypothetical protein
MSIYARLGELGFKRFDDDAYIELLIQAVPPHIVETGPQWDFLPPPVDPNGRLYRAVFVVKCNETKGTSRSNEEYPHSLLNLIGQEYHDIRFVELMHRLEEALDARYGTPAWKSQIDPKNLRWYID